MTAHENYRGQILWISASIGFIMLLLVALGSESALNHQSRLVDVSSYFLIDIVSLVTGAFMGSFLYSRDFSNRGIAELAIPNGLSRIQLFAWRWVSNAACLFLFAAVMYAVRLLTFWLAATTTPQLIASTGLMLLLTSLKATLAFTMAAMLGSFARPVIALMGSIGLFGIGHFSAGLHGLQGMLDETRVLSPFEEFLFKTLKVWNPNHLTLESFRGAWETPTAQEILLRCGWGFAAIAFFLCVACVGIRNRDVGAMNL